MVKKISRTDRRIIFAKLGEKVEKIDGAVMDIHISKWRDAHFIDIINSRSSIIIRYTSKDKDLIPVVTNMICRTAKVECRS